MKRASLWNRVQKISLTRSAFKFVNAKGMLFLFQVLAETVLIPQIFDDFLIRKAQGGRT